MFVILFIDIFFYFHSSLTMIKLMETVKI